MKTLDELIFSVTHPEDDDAAAGVPDLLLYSPCPVKLAVKDGIDAVVARMAAEGYEPCVHIPMGCTSVDPYDPLYRETDPERLPDIIASIGFGDFFREEFVQRFVQTGEFSAVLPEAVSPLHARNGLLDPSGHYVLYGLTAYMFLVDTKRLGDLPVPRRWADLLDPVYRGHINMCGDGDDMADAVLINIYKDFGMDGIRRFAANTHGLMHSSRMAKSGGVAKSGAIYVIPYFFAESTKQPEHMQVVWPEDGAAASPLYFLVKTSARDRLKPLVDFFIHGFGQIDSARWFLPVGGPMPDNLPEDALVKWVGWDYIRSNDITGIRDMLNASFRTLVRETPVNADEFSV